LRVGAHNYVPGGWQMENGKDEGKKWQHFAVGAIPPCPPVRRKAGLPTG